MKFFITHDFEEGGCLHYLSALSCVDGFANFSFSHKREDALLFDDYELEEIESLVSFLNSLPNSKLYREYGTDKFKVFKFVFKYHTCRK